MSLTIALVEDDTSILQMYQLRLEMSGFRVVTANNGFEGLNLVRAKQPDLLLLDIKMPVMSGEEMLKQLRMSEAGASIRVFVLTNISRDEAPRSLQMLNVERYIVKAHHTPKQIVEMIQETLGSSIPV